MRLIQSHLKNDEEQDLRVRASQPLTRTSPLSSAPDGEMKIGLASSSTPPNPLDYPSQDIEVESVLTWSLTKSSKTFSLRSVRRFGTSYHSAGLFNDCRHVFFNNDSEVSVFKLGDLRGKPASPSFSRVFVQHYKNKECIRNVASSQSGIIVVTNKRLLVFDIGAETPIRATWHGDWDPSGLASHETETHCTIFLGQCQRNENNKYNGRIRVYRYRKDCQSENLPVFVLDVSANDCPKRLSFHADSQILTCITRLQNKLLGWKLDDDFSSSIDHFEFLKNNYTAVSAQRLTAPADGR